MKKIMFALMLLAGGAALLLSAGSSSADDPGIPPVFSTKPRLPDPQALVCYDLRHGDNENANAVLETATYGQDEVRIRKLVMLCELSNMYTFKIPAGFWFYLAPKPPAIAETTIFACYTLQNGDDPGMGANLTTQSFGKDQVLIDTSNLMCESARKHVVNADGYTSTYGTGTDTILQCFETSLGDDPNLAAAFANNNFGDEPVVMGAGIGMCEEGVKYREVDGRPEVTGTAAGVAYQCFAIARWQDDRQVEVTLETANFGSDDVTVGRASQLCQLAKKGDFHVVTSNPPGHP